MTNDIAIRVQNLSKCYHLYDKPRDRLLQMLSFGHKQYYREFWALKDVSFEIKKGETVGVIGRNGSGKSTLLQLICGTLNPTDGDIQTHGRIAALLELGSGFNPDFTGRENIYLNGNVLGLSNQEIDARYNDIVAFAEIGNFIDQPVKTYSSGMYVRLAFAIQANIDPEILIVDEALAVGDAYFVHRCMLRFHELQEAGTTILFASHDAGSVKRLCSKALWLKDGYLIEDGPAITVVDAYLNDLFDIDENKHNGGSPTRLEIGKSLAVIEKPVYHMPEGDARQGSGLLELVGMRLADLEGKEIKLLGWNSILCLSMIFKNNGLSKNTPVSAGYIVRDFKGIEIASSNSVWESFEILTPAIGDTMGIVFEIGFPMLHPGFYSITPTVSSIESDGEHTIQDRIVNAFLVEVVSEELIVTPMRFPTTIKSLHDF